MQIITQKLTAVKWKCFTTPEWSQATHILIYKITNIYMLFLHLGKPSKYKKKCEHFNTFLRGVGWGSR